MTNLISDLQPIFTELSDQEAQGIQGGSNSNNGGPHVTGNYIDFWADGEGGTFIIRPDGSEVHYNKDGIKDMYVFGYEISDLIEI